jgi:hypothetical protein
VLQLVPVESLSPGKFGSQLHVPESSQRLLIDNLGWLGRVLAMTPRRKKDGSPGYEDFKVGDLVQCMLRMEDLKTPERLIVTDTTRVYAVVEDETVKADETEGYVFA